MYISKLLLLQMITDIKKMNTTAVNNDRFVVGIASVTSGQSIKVHSL